jgi:GxxExxY protein
MLILRNRPESGGQVLAPSGVMLRPFDRVEGVVHRVIGCAIEVHKVMGPGLLESVYRECLVMELRARGVGYEAEVRVPIAYKEQRLHAALRLDLLVEGCVVVEAKAVAALHPVHEAQVITYLKLTGCPAGLLMNFNEVLLKDGLRRLDHPERYAATRRR